MIYWKANEELKNAFIGNERQWTARKRVIRENVSPNMQKEESLLHQLKLARMNLLRM